MNDNPDSDSGNARRKSVAAFLTLAIFVVLPAAMVSWCLIEHILERSWWMLLGIVGVTVIVALFVRHLVGFFSVEAFVVWITTALLVCVVLSMYAKYSEKKDIAHVSAIRCFNVGCSKSLWPSNALQPTVNPLHGLSGAEFGRWAAQ